MKKNKVLTLAFLCSGIVALSVPAFVNASNKASISVNAATELTVDAKDVIIWQNPTTSQDKDYVFFTMPVNSLSKGESGELRFKATAASGVVTHTKLDGTSQSHAVNLCKQTDTRYYLQFDNWAGDNFQVEVGESVTLKGTATRASGDSLTFPEIVFIHKAVGTWSIKVDETVYKYNDSNITSVSTNYHAGTSESDKTYNIFSFGVNEKDSFPVDSGWDKFYEVENGALITPADGSGQITKNLLVYKPAEQTYGFMWMDHLWNSAVFDRTWYDFKVGDKVEINNISFSYVDGLKAYTVELNNFVLSFNGASFDTYRPTMIQKAITALNNLDETVTYTPECKAKIDAASEAYSYLSSLEAKDVPANLLIKLSNQKNEYALLEAKAQGKTTHVSEVEADSISASAEMSHYDTGCQARVNDLDFPTEAVWSTYYRGINDSKIIKPSGRENSLNSAAVVFVGDDSYYRITFIFVNWVNPKPSTEAVFSYGDRYVVNETSYSTQTDTDYYLLKFPGADFMWTGSMWIDTASCPTLPELVNKIDAIGTVTYSSESRAKIDAAKAVYEAMSEDEAKWVVADLTDKIEAAESAYKDAEAQAKANDVVTLIDNIGTVTLSDECKAKIDLARSSYDGLSTASKEKVPANKVQVLEAAEAKYADLVDEQEAAKTVNLINAIGTVTYTATSKEKIDAARTSYNNLNENAQSKVSEEEYQVLLDAEKKYSSLKAIDDFKNAVNSLSASSSNDQIYSVVLQAKTYYNKIEDKTLVASEYATLLTYIEKYNTAVSEVNDAHDKNEDVATNIIVASVATASLLGIALALLSKKGVL